MSRSLPHRPVGAGVVVADAADADRVFDVLTLAFAADPPNRWMYPDAAAYIRHFPSFARGLGGAALPHGTAFRDKDCAAVALWLGPGIAPDEAALMALFEATLPPDRRADLAAVIHAMEGCHPREPHWYLPFIGVDPARQGTGLGAALLQPVLAACDAARLPAYLESTNPRNQRFYERHGFRAVGEIRVGACPPVVPMLRRPGAPR
ncbi:MAG: GNAT family N-acetyltransferase [Alphaproteobacteria bacterium]|nr:GNAT family N-acetyltransferase [Alphaproteobacteria bacterium]